MNPIKLLILISVGVCSSSIAVAEAATALISGVVIDDSGKAVSGLVDVHRVRQFTRDQTGRLVGEATNFSAAVSTDATVTLRSAVPPANISPAPTRAIWGIYRIASGTRRFR